MEMSPEEMERRNQTVLGMCICRDCPSWVECGERGGYCLFAIGKSGCITREHGCTCGGCPVTSRMDLKHDYYCTRGSEKAQLGK